MNENYYCYPLENNINSHRESDFLNIYSISPHVGYVPNSDRFLLFYLKFHLEIGRLLWQLLFKIRNYGFINKINCTTKLFPCFNICRLKIADCIFLVWNKFQDQLFNLLLENWILQCPPLPLPAVWFLFFAFKYQLLKHIYNSKHRDILPDCWEIVIDI